MEGTGIVIRGHIGAIVRGNEIHHFFNGIYTGSSGALENSALAFDADIYNNHIHHISDDGLEPEGACINQRFRNNTVDMVYVGISLAPITQGPTWVLRSLFTNYTGRAIKWDGNPDGIVLIYHNTSWTNAKDANGMDLISPIHNVVMRNNIFQMTGYGFQEVRTGSTGNDWNNDNWYTTRALASGHFKWENLLYNSTAKLCVATGLECKGYEDPPGLANPGGGDFTLPSTSPNVDRGIAIPDINDGFTGNAPDVGAYESTSVFDAPPRVLSSVRADTNPTDAARVSQMAKPLKKTGRAYLFPSLRSPELSPNVERALAATECLSEARRAARVGCRAPQPPRSRRREPQSSRRPCPMCQSQRRRPRLLQGSWHDRRVVGGPGGALVREAACTP
jgi:hypothetical protein